MPKKDKETGKPANWAEMPELTSPPAANSPHAFVQQQMRKKKSARKAVASAPKKKDQG